MNNTKGKDQLIKLLETRTKALAAERDKLRGIMDKIGQYENIASEAIESLEEAIEKLSELV